MKVEQISIQGDHWHLIVRTSRRSNFQNFLRVVAGQTAQRFSVEGLTRFREVTDTPLVKRDKLWMHRPFTRVVKGHRAYRTVQDYVQLNEQEALGNIPYRKERLNGLGKKERERLWLSPRARGFNGDRYPPSPIDTRWVWLEPGPNLLA